jgi:Domain of unknown function (DUF4160)
MKIITAIASTTHIDRHHEKMAKTALDGMSEQIAAKYIPFLIEHDPNRAIGVILAGKVLPMDDGEWALMIVVSIWENFTESKEYEYGEKNTTWEKHMHYLQDVAIPLKTVTTNTRENVDIRRPKTYADLLEMHLDSIEVWPDGRVIRTKRFIASTGDLQIHIYPNDHLPPHFHVRSKQRKIDARFDLYSLEIISNKQGQTSINDQKKIKHFFVTNPSILAELNSEYERFHSSQS